MVMSCLKWLMSSYLLNAGTYGLVDYTNYEDMKYAVSLLGTRSAKSFKLLLFLIWSKQLLKHFWINQIRKLDDSEFRNPWTRTYIRVSSTFLLFFVLSIAFIVHMPSKFLTSTFCSFIFVPVLVFLPRSRSYDKISHNFLRATL